MSLRETRAFLQDLVLRFDPEQDISEGSRADAELIQPILDRIGPDPFDEDIHVFVRERIRQAFPDRAITEVDELTDILIDPFRVLCEPLVREVKLAKLRSSLKNAESLSDDEVDALMANFFKPRLAGGFATGVVRVFFSSPQTISVSQPQIASTRAGLQFLPTRPQGITQDQMALNIVGSEYYFDINYTARNRGDEYNVEANEIVSIANLPTAIRVRNLRRFRNGTPQEDNPDYIGRVERSISDGTLTAERGIISTLTEAFPDIRSILVIGFHDPEMLRDIVRGGSLGAIPTDDSLGSFFGVGTADDDQDGDLSTQLLGAVDGHFVTRVAAAGDAPTSWYVTLFYTSSSALVVADVQIEEVISDTRIRVDHEIPLDATGLGWALRERKLTISDIPGGITLPDTAAGTLEIGDDAIHIGGKVDIYIGGDTEIGTASITSLTDESPIAKGYDAQTQGSTPGSEAIVLLADLGVSSDLLEPGMSLVLEEGEDVNSYRILEVLTAPDRVRVDQDMTGTQTGITWKVVDDIDVELTDPKNIKAEGDDLITAAGASSVTTSSGFNFLDGDVAEGDILEITAERGGGEFTVTEVTATALFVEPVTPRTIGAASWRVFSRSEAVQTPIVRVSALELLDAVGAPNGTKIPYRDPVLVRSTAFQNEGQGFVYDNLTRTGIVTLGLAPGSTFLPAPGGHTILWELRDPEAVWGIPGGGDSGTFTFSAGSKTAAQIVSEINADATLDASGIKALVLTSADGDQEFVGFLAERRLRFVGGTALAYLSLFIGISNSTVVSAAPGPVTFLTAAVRLGDLVEIVSGPNSGVSARAVAAVFSTGYGGFATTMGNGPISPGGYDLAVLAPSIEARARVGRPSFGSARVFFLDPTSAEFHYRDTRFSVEIDGRVLEYRPDPENSRQVLPAVPSPEVQGPAALDLVSSSKTLTDAEVDFLSLGIRSGDLLDVLFSRIEGTGPMASPGTVAVSGKTLRIRIADGAWVSINFPFDMPRQDVVDYINTSLGADVASLSSGVLHLIYRERLEVDPTSTAITSGDPLLLSGADLTTDNGSAGTYTIAAVASTVLTLSPLTATGGAPSTTYYRIRRFVQRISSTEMNTQVDASGLYYADVQLVSLGPGDDYNIQAALDLEVTGYVSDGYRLSTDNSVLSFSRAEVLRAEISKSILLVGSSDSPEEYVQLSQQNVQVTYDRSALVDAAQSFVDARFNRVVCSEPLVRHLQPHYVSMTWNYVAGPAEAEGVRLLTDYLSTIEVDDGLEVNDLTNVLRRKSATSVYITDAAAPSGRAAPLMVIVYHTVERAVRAVIVSDVVDTVRTQRFMPGTITLRRVSPGGIR